MIIYLVTGAYLFFFLTVYLRDRSRLVNGFLFFILMILGGLSLVMLAYDTQSAFLSALVLGLVLAFVLFLMTGLFIIMIVSLVNGAILLRRERRSLSNLLSLLLGLGILGWMFLNTLSFSSPLAQGLFSAAMMVVNTLFLYLLAVFSLFILSSFAYQLYYPLASPDYIIVLGSGLIRGREVPPLLAGRIDKAVRIYRRCVRRGKRPPTLILSGGQGPDEAIPEGEAMRLYALGQGVEDRHLLVEGRSRNTYENMLFSKQLIEARDPPGSACTSCSPPPTTMCFAQACTPRKHICGRRASARAPGFISGTTQCCGNTPPFWP